MNTLRITLVQILLVVLLGPVLSLLSVQIAHAEIFYSSAYGFKIDMPDDWSKTKPTKPWTLVTYAKLGSGTNLNINVIDAKGIKSIKQASLKELFYPYFEDITFHEKEYKSKGNIVFLKIIFTVRDGELKQQWEGRHRLKYMAIQWVRDGRLFTLTFADLETNFNKTLPVFNKATNSIDFLK